MVTVREVRFWMKKFDIPNISKVTSRNKSRFLDIVLKKAVIKSGGEMNFAKDATIDVTEDYGMKYKGDIISLDVTMKRLEKKGIDPSIDVARFLERQLKSIEEKKTPIVAGSVTIPVRESKKEIAARMRSKISDLEKDLARARNRGDIVSESKIKKELGEINYKLAEAVTIQ